MEVVTRQTQLLQVVGALDAPSRLASHLNGWQEQRDENANDGNHYEELKESEPLPLGERHTRFLDQ